MTTIADKAEELTAGQTNAAGQWVADKLGVGDDPAAVADAQAVLAHGVGLGVALLTVLATKLLPKPKP